MFVLMSTYQTVPRRRGRARREPAHAHRATWSGAQLAREHPGAYDPTGNDDDQDGDHDDAGEVGPGLRDKVRHARQTLGAVLAAATDPTEPGGGELGALLDLLAGIDTAQAAAVELIATAQRHGLAERSAALPLDGLLSFSSRATYGDRRTLTAIAEQLPTMPHLRTAFHAGVVGWAEVRTILAEARALNADQRAELDAGFADHHRLARLDPDRLVEAVQDEVARLRPDRERERTRRAIERRYLALQPALDGTGTGYFELDAPAYGAVTAAIQAALTAPSAGPNDITRDAVGEADPDGADTEDTPDGDPGFCDHPVDRSLARRRADALVRLAEVFLAGPTTAAGTHSVTDPAATTAPATATGLTGTPGAAGASTNAAEAVTSTAARPLSRARPLLHAICDVNHLTGHDSAARLAARALLATAGGPLRLTPETIRRLACDARLQLIFTDQGQVLGTTDPTDDIPLAVRRALWARDQGCRFPGCTAPAHWTDAHHVTYREHGGPTTLDNLVLLCRRHHTAVHEGGWRLTLDPDATVHIRRGRRRHTADPPLRRTLLPD